MTDIENLKLPQPIKVKPSIARYLDNLEEQGKTIFAFAGAGFVETIAYLYLLNKYQSKCISRANKNKNLWYKSRPIGITIPLKVNYSKDDEVQLKESFTEISKNLVNCIKRGERTIIIPLGYTRNLGGHANMLILRMNTRELEHYEPHGNEYIGNEKLQLGAKRVLTFFVNILNRELKKENLPEIKYIEASEVCPYISGFQSLEGESKLPTRRKLEPKGYCAAWSIFFAELCLKNSDIPSSELLDNIYNYLTTKESGPDYLKGVIRGYAGYISQQVNLYLSVFFKHKITVKELLDNPYSMKNAIVNNVLNVLVDLETYITMNPDFDLKKELKKSMKEYRDLTKGKTKEEQIAMRRGSHIDKKVQNAYYKKRILQNFEEYKSLGRVTSDPVFDSPEEIDREQIKNLDVIKKGLGHEMVAEERKKREEELMKEEWYRKMLKQKEDAKKVKAKTKKQMKERDTYQIEKIKAHKSKTQKHRLPDELKEKINDKEKANMLEELIKKHKINMSTKEGQQKFLKLLQEIGKK